MFSSLGRGRDTPAGRFRPMKAADRDAAYQITLGFDEDDAEALAETLSETVGGFFVIERGGEVLGFTGYDPIPDSAGSAWLSWTYVADDLRGQGIGRALMDGLRAELSGGRTQRLFVSTSNYTEDGEDVYAPARRFYQAQGAQLALRVADYYAPGEDRFVYRLDLAPAGFAAEAPCPPGTLAFVGFDAVEESEGARCLLWDVVAEDTDPNVLPRIVDGARAEGAHVLFASLPSEQSRLGAAHLDAAGFEPIGRIADFYGTGQHEEHWACRLGGGR